MRFRTTVIKSFALLVVLGTGTLIMVNLVMANQAMAQDAAAPYPTMAPVEQYLDVYKRQGSTSTAKHSREKNPEK